jgi:hypothetical protein
MRGTFAQPKLSIEGDNPNQSGFLVYDFSGTSGLLR